MDPHVPAASEPAASEPQPVVSTESSGQIPATATPQPTAVPAAPAFDMTSTLADPVKKWIAYSVIAGVVALIGSLGPWVVVSAGILGGVSVSYTHLDVYKRQRGAGLPQRVRRRHRVRAAAPDLASAEDG